VYGCLRVLHAAGAAASFLHPVDYFFGGRRQGECGSPMRWLVFVEPFDLLFAGQITMYGGGGRPAPPVGQYRGIAGALLVIQPSLPLRWWAVPLARRCSCLLHAGHAQPVAQCIRADAVFTTRCSSAAYAC